MLSNRGLEVSLGDSHDWLMYGYSVVGALVLWGRLTIGQKKPMDTLIFWRIFSDHLEHRISFNS